MNVKVGTYAGSASALAVTGVGFQPDVVLIKSAAAQFAVIASDTTGGKAKPLSGSTALTTGLITSLDPDGFSVGTDARTNAAATTFYYLALKKGSGTCATLAYTGTGSALPITGLGFQPDVVLILNDQLSPLIMRLSTAAGDSGQSMAGADGTALITSIDSDGFTLGTSTNVNQNGNSYHAVAFKAQTGVCALPTPYTGNGTSQTITGAGFQPEFAFVKGAAITTAIMRFKDETGLNSLPVTGSAENTTSITALTSDGFSVGSSGNVNTSAGTYRAVVLKGYVSPATSRTAARRRGLLVPPLKYVVGLP